MSIINLLIVDDNKIQATGLTRLFQDCESINFRGNVLSPESCLSRLANDKMIDIILLDVKFPDSEMDGIGLANEIRRRYPFSESNGKTSGPRLIFFSVEKLGFVDRERGIHGLIPKHEDFHKIVQMIEMVHHYGATFPPELTPKEKPEFWKNLTEQESGIFCLVLQDNSSKDIAKILKLSEQTIQTHRKNILKKIRASGLKIDRIDHPQMVKLVLEHKLCKI